MNSVAVERAFDAKKINQIVNHSSVYEWVKGACDGPLDLTPAITGNDNIYALQGEHGAIIFHRLQPGLFECHSQCVPEGRGQWMLDFTNACLKWIFGRTEAVECITRAPKGNLAAKALAKAIGGQHEFVLPKSWIKDGQPVDCEIYSLTIQTWMKSAPDLPSRGKWFHARLKAEFDRLGISEPQHADDETHDRYVGAACEMIFGGQPDKACVFYNRVAMLAGWHPISVISLDPLVIHIGSAILVMRGDDFFVVPPQKPAQ